MPNQPRADNPARAHAALYDPSMTGRTKCYYCPRCHRYVTSDHAEEQANAQPAAG